MEIIFAPGGCGNLINNCLRSVDEKNLIIRWYQNVNPRITWTEQEWAIRTKDVIHNVKNSGICLAWDNSLDTSMHYIIKNIKMNHLKDDPAILGRVKTIIDQNYEIENKIKENSYYQVEPLLTDPKKMFDLCHNINNKIEYETICTIQQLWIDKTRLYYEQHSEEVLGYFQELKLDYQPTTVYNILYENFDLR